MRTALRRNGCALTKRAIAISQLAITRYTYSKISNFKMAEQGEEFEQGIAEGTVFGRRKVFVIHDGLEEAKLDKICMESDGRHYFKAVEDTRHSPLSATMARSCIGNGPLCTLTSEKETVRQWAQFRPTITVIVLGQQDLIKLKLMRDGRVYAHWAQGTIKELVEEGREFTEDKMEYDYRMRWGHWFLLATPKCLMESMSQIQPGEYDKIKTAATDAMLKKREEFYEENVIVFKVGVNIVENIREAVSKLLCLRCRNNYSNYGTPVKCFGLGGCDDPKGESLLMDMSQKH